LSGECGVNDVIVELTQSMLVAELRVFRLTVGLGRWTFRGEVVLLSARIFANQAARIHTLGANREDH
jgi:hypothetical protein